jgi:sulfoxide reductase heme-binding subunit YedZ
MLSKRMRDRLWRHHLPVGFCTLGAGFLLYVTRGYPDVITRLSFSSAWPALVLLAVTLAIGPWRTLRGKAPLLSQDLRRDWGIWAGMAGVFHAVIGQCVHLRGRPWLYYIYEKLDEHVVPLRHDIFGFSNYTGLVSALILAALLATSSDAMMKKLGNPGWKKLQRWNYYCAALAALHTFGYLLGIEAIRIASITVAAVCVLAALGLQLAGWRRRAAA